MIARNISIYGGVIAGLLAIDIGSALAADLFRHRHHRSNVAADVYADDYACPIQEPAFYRPRVANYHEPLCYAARPYGISTHLYDHSRELGAYNSAAGY